MGLFHRDEEARQCSCDDSINLRLAETLAPSPSTFVSLALLRQTLSIGEGRRNLTVHSDVTVPGQGRRCLGVMRVKVAARFPWQPMRTEMIPPLPKFPKAT